MPSFANSSKNMKPQPQTVINGISLYEEHCARCHRPFDKTTKPQRRISRLRSSIKHIPAMSKFVFLSDVQLGDIASALATRPLQKDSRRN
jgi:mono/diheme cytochrome c family protein